MIDESELSHIYKHRTGQYRPDFHFTLLRAGKQKINAKRVKEKFGSFDFGAVNVSEIHLSSLIEFEDATKRMTRDQWKKVKNHQATYACEYKITLI